MFNSPKASANLADALSRKPAKKSKKKAKRGPRVPKGLDKILGT